MEIILCLFSAGFVLLVGYYCMKESDEARLKKQEALQRIRRMQEERDRVVREEFARQSHKNVTPRSAPITTGKPAATTRPVPQVSRRDNSFDNDVDSGSTPTYHSSHSSGSSYSSHSCSSSSSSSSDSSSSSSDSGGGGCD